MEKILVFQSNVMMKADVLEEKRLKILEEIKDGVVVLPPWLLLVGVYDEVEVPEPPVDRRVLRIIMERRGDNGPT